MRESDASVPRARPWYKALDAVLTARLRPALRWRGRIAALLRWRTSRFDRTAHAAVTLDVLWPTLFDRVLGSVLRCERTPLRRRALEPFAFGTGSIVFRIDGDPQLVLKTYRISTGRRLTDVRIVARLVDTTYRTLLAWYGREHGLVPPTLVLVGPGPVRGVPSALALQRRVVGDARDLLGHDDDELLELAVADAGFAASLERFLGGTLDAWLREGRCIDLLGQGNVLLVRERDGASIRIVDFGIFELDEKRRRAPVVHRRTLRRLERMQELRGELAARLSRRPA